MEVFNHEGLECKLGDQTYDDSVRGRQERHFPGKMEKLDIGMLSDYFSSHTSMLTFLICFSVSPLIARSSMSLSVVIYSSQ